MRHEEKKNKPKKEKKRKIKKRNEKKRKRKENGDDESMTRQHTQDVQGSMSLSRRTKRKNT